jgi:hypothetical protein
MRAPRNRATYRRIGAAGRLDGLVPVAGEYLAPARLRMATFQDLTLLQALRAYPWPRLRGLSHGEIGRRVRLQRSVYTSAYACCTASHWAAESLAIDYGLPPRGSTPWAS